MRGDGVSIRACGWMFTCDHPRIFPRKGEERARNRGSSIMHTSESSSYSLGSVELQTSLGTSVHLFTFWRPRRTDEHTSPLISLQLYIMIDPAYIFTVEIATVPSAPYVKFSFTCWRGSGLIICTVKLYESPSTDTEVGSMRASYWLGSTLAETRARQSKAD